MGDFDNLVSIRNEASILEVFKIDCLGLEPDPGDCFPSGSLSILIRFVGVSSPDLRAFCSSAFLSAFALALAAAAKRIVSRIFG